METNTHPREILEVTIEKFDHKGRGVAKYVHPPVGSQSQGPNLFIHVPSTLPGDIVQVTVENARGRRRAVVDYDKIIQPAPTRIGQWAEGEPRAGGTPLGFMDYQAQLDYKENYVKECLVGEGFSEELVQPILGMEDPYFYRNKMELTFGKDGAIGMHEQGNYRRIVDYKESLIAPEEMLEVKNEVSAWQQEWKLASYDKDTKEGLLRHLMIRKSHATGELMVVLFTTEDTNDLQEEVEDLAQRMSGRFENLASLIWIKNTDVADRTQAQEEFVLYGRDFIYDELSGFQYQVWFDTFFQPNPIQAEKMVEIALEFAQVDDSMRVLDLFCGVGTFSLPFAAHAKELAGIEIVETSIESAKYNAKENGIDNTYFLARDARKGMSELEETWGKPDLILLDPPRDGAGGKVMRRIGRLETDKVVYVSCNPKSLAEDLVWLRDFGYELKSVQPVDQFPHTLHVESIAWLEKVE